MGLLLALLACAHMVQVTSEPAGAVMELPSGDRVSLPAEIELRAPPFQAPQVTVRAPGYRSLELTVRRLVNGPWLSTTDEVHLVLIPEHGPSGTWTKRSEGL